MHPSERATTNSQGAFVISRSWSGDYVWKLQDAQGRVLDSSVRHYDSYESCHAAIERIRHVAANAVIAGTAISGSD